MNNVLDIRKRLALSQVELSQALGVTQSMISQYEKGASNPSLTVARGLIKFAASKNLALTLEMIYLEAAESQACRHG